MLTSLLCAQKASVKPDALFSSEQGNLIRSSVFRNANPSNLRGSLFKGNMDHLLSSPSTSASVNCNDKQKSKDWRYRTHKTDSLR